MGLKYGCQLRIFTREISSINISFGFLVTTSLSHFRWSAIGADGCHCCHLPLSCREVKLSPVWVCPLAKKKVSDVNWSCAARSLLWVCCYILIRLAQDSKIFKLHELVGCQIGTSPKVRLLSLCVVFRELHFLFKGKLQVFFLVFFFWSAMISFCWFK